MYDGGGGGGRGEDRKWSMVSFLAKVPLTAREK